MKLLLLARGRPSDRVDPHAGVHLVPPRDGPGEGRRGRERGTRLRHLDAVDPSALRQAHSSAKACSRCCGLPMRMGEMMECTPPHRRIHWRGLDFGVNRAILSSRLVHRCGRASARSPRTRASRQEQGLSFEGCAVALITSRWRASWAAASRRCPSKLPLARHRLMFGVRARPRRRARRRQGPGPSLIGHPVGAREHTGRDLAMCGNHRYGARRGDAVAIAGDPVKLGGQPQGARARRHGVWVRPGGRGARPYTPFRSVDFAARATADALRPDGSLTMFLNGEVYNFAVVRGRARSPRRYRSAPAATAR